MSSKKIVAIVLSAVVVLGVALVLGLSKSSDTESITQGSVFEENSCVSDFETLYASNKADLSSCSIAIRDGEFSAPKPVSKQNNVVLIFDSSGSMAGLVDGEKKIDIAKSAVSDFVDQLRTTNVKVSVVIYGHMGDNTEAKKALSCSGIEELYSLGEAEGAKIESTLRSFAPTGWTPIAGALEQSYAILAKYNNEQNNNSIILISDGIETCGGDPVGIVDAMKVRGLNVTANVIGFDVTEADSQQLRAIASSGNGEYFNAKNKADLDFALQKHTAYMEQFDYRMNRVSENLEDINSATELHFNCVEALETERAHMMLDIYADVKVSPQCAEKVDSLYSELYESNKKNLWESFNSMMRDFKQKSQ